MSLTLKKRNAVQALAAAMHDYLPGGGADAWKGHVNFGSVAASAGVGEFWQAQGSKLPRLTSLFEQTLLHRPQSFEKLILAIVQHGIPYREKKGSRLMPEDIRILNGHLQDLEFRFPDLWDSGFLNALELDDTSRARKNVAAAEQVLEERSSRHLSRLRELSALRGQLEELHAESNRQRAGFALERLLNQLFALFQLAPRSPFRVVGEQIDGSFELDAATYLVEAKWEHEPSPLKDLLVFRSKIDGKSRFTRGVFLAMNGVSDHVAQALVTGKQPTFFVMNGHDLMMVLQAQIPLDDYLRIRRRLLEEEGAVSVRFDVAVRGRS